MEHQNKWPHYKNIDWLDTKFNLFSVDTRDFHVGYTFDEPKTLNKIIKETKYRTRFFYTLEELKETLDYLFVESGGEQEWRFLSVEFNDKRLYNWNLKYLRIYRIDFNHSSEPMFIICNSNKIALTKAMLKAKIVKEHL